MASAACPDGSARRAARGYGGEVGGVPSGRGAMQHASLFVSADGTFGEASVLALVAVLRSVLVAVRGGDRELRQRCPRG